MSNSGAKGYVIVVVIIILMLIMGPEIAVTVFFGTNGFASVEITNWRLVMHLMGIVFLIVMAIAYYFSRDKHAVIPIRREGHLFVAVIIAVVATYAIGVNYVIGMYPSGFMHLGVLVLFAILSGLTFFSFHVIGIYPLKFMRPSTLFLLTILLGLIVFSYFIARYSDTGMYHCIGGFDQLQILYVAANQTSREIYCKVLNTGSHLLTIDEVKVNDSKVITKDLLPVIIRPFCVRDYKTFVFRYDGPWKGSIVIGFHTLPFPADWEKLVDLQVASSNPIDGAYPDKFELLSIYFYRNLGEIARYMEAVLWGSITAFLAVEAQIILRGLKKMELRVEYMLIMMLLASSLVPYRLHTNKRPLVTFSEDGDITGDGGGPYVDGVAYMRIDVYDMVVYPSNGFGFDGYLSPRTVRVRLGGVPWKDENLRDMPPRLPSENLSMELYITFRKGTIPDIKVGERLEPTEIEMRFINPDSGLDSIEMTRDLIYYPPPAELINEGHAYLVGEGEDTWVLDVDAWFRNADWAYDVNPPKYWVRLRFIMTIKLQSLI